MKHRDGILDLVRGISALLVMLGHLRGFLFVDFADLAAPSLSDKVIYFVTGLGHQAVMVFFVLSGYFVGGAVLSGLRDERFGWLRYGVARLTRLWVVLVPALVLTFGIDQLGNYWNPGAYAGEFHGLFMSGPATRSPADHGVLTALGNLAFLQTIAVPVFGSDGPLWSLANEFWYYLIFPLAAVSMWRIWTFFSRKAVPSSPASCLLPPASCLLPPASCLLLFAFLLWWLPWGLLSAGAIWLLGVAVWGAAKGRFVFRGARNWAWNLIFGSLFLGSLAASKVGGFGSWGDYGVGLAFALWMPSLLGPWRKAGWWSRLATGLSESSYTLYVVHFPILFFVAAVILRGRQFVPGVAGFSWFVGLAFVVLAIAGGMWWVFERNTGRVRRWTGRRLI